MKRFRRAAWLALLAQLGAAAVLWALRAGDGRAESCPAQPVQMVPPLAPPGPPPLDAPPAVPPLDAPLPAQDFGRVDPPVPVVSIRVRVPAEAEPDKELSYRIQVENVSRARAYHVIVTNPLPANVRFVKATPEPTPGTPQKMCWHLGTLEPGARKEILLVVVPTGAGDVRNCARVQFEHGECVRTRVPRPELRVRTSGPRAVQHGEPLTLHLEVTNTGRAAATGVVLTDKLPEALQFEGAKPPPDGKKPLTWKLGTLAPGQTRRVEFWALATELGRHENRAVVEAAGGLRQESAHDVLVGEPKLKVAKTGPARRLVNRPTTYHITVTNTGNVAAKKVQVSDGLPDLSTKIAFDQASPGGRLVKGQAVPGGEAVSDQVRWDLGTLQPGERRTVWVVLRGLKPLWLTNAVTATADPGYLAQATAVTKFIEAAGLAADIDRGPGPVRVGRETTYTVWLVNAGKAPATRVGLTVVVPEAMKLTGARGPTASEQDGQKVVFAPLPALAPGAEATYTVTVQPLKPGPAELTADVSSEQAGPTDPVRVRHKTAVRPDGRDKEGGEPPP